ncbi:MAG: cold shock domain-containing protein [Desulfobacterales bacterium]|nr:cold shock domain-containing protein [Desulfobacterales bacterium]
MSSYGKVKKFDSSKGFGFILSDNGKEVFVHKSQIRGNGPKILAKGESVTFEIEKGQKGLRANNVIKVKAVGVGTEKGKITLFDRSKRCGSILTDHGKEVYFGFVSVQYLDMRTLAKGQRVKVQFDITPDKLIANKVELIGDVPPVNPEKKSPKKTLRPYICYSPDDESDVRELYLRLKSDGIEPWFDKEKLVAGQDWKMEKKKAIRESDVVIVCLSHNSNKSGYVHKEIMDALDIAYQQPKGTIFIIPVKLNKCETPEEFKDIHEVNLFEGRGYGDLKKALKHRAVGY